MKGVFWLLVATAVCASAVFWFVTSRDVTKPSQQTAASSVTARQDAPAVEPEPQIAAVDQGDSRSALADASDSSDTPNATDVPQIIVDSFDSSERVPLDGWTSIDEFVGHFDVFVRDSDGAAVEEGLLLGPADLLIAQGWAGNQALGLNLSDVVFSACGQIIARAQIAMPRPDVAEAVHPNLMNSGWRAEILAADLPACAASNVRAWGIVPGALARLAPLARLFPYVSPESSGAPSRLSAQQTVGPDDYPKPEFVALQIKASKANLRKCGSTSCSVVGQVDGGRYTAHIATRDPEWSLIVFSGGAGWLFNDLFEVAP